ncbi:MAG: Bacterial ribosome SSU maturation protein RimP [uncultured Sphingomonadaceae bacterium]|uniref:Ribosome maturation factor RimP n=1 Tax=uncultured Sphingomonadaceae bacterium TaxID=169976 RepID=A0A6J4S5J5_9SPHN|nr:MAG: Bacterial ribosome SSU maturation protein RimP [uncultured Sphingomonadaceae bacterium]
MADIARLTEIIEPHAKALGLSLVRVQMIGGKGEPTLQVMAERPDTRQLDLADCTALSHRLSDALDALEAAGADPIETAYRLEVSSPGIDRPLTRLADYRDWAGFEARVTLAEPIEGRKQFTGKLGGVAGEDIRLEPASAGGTPVLLPFAAVAKAKLVLTDELIKATAPLSSAGADEVIEDTATEGAESIKAEEE